MNARIGQKRTVATATLTLIGIAALYGCGGGVTTVTDGGTGFLPFGQALGGFRAIQVDPPSEDSAGPQFVVAEDLNGDGRLDLISAWNQSQPVQIHLQERTASGRVAFETITIAGSIPTIAVAGLSVADFNGDGRPDIAVLIKESLLDGAGCLGSEVPGSGLRGEIVLYLGPDDPAQTNQALAWDEVQIGQSFLQGSGQVTASPEEGGFTGMVVGDINRDGNLDIAVAWNSSCDGGRSGVLVFLNNGPGAVADGSWTTVPIPDSAPNGGVIKDVALGDIDRDGDLDIVATYPNAQTMNVRWYRNPEIDVPDDFHLSGPDWQVGSVGHVASGADKLKMSDIDQDGIVDVVVRSTNGNLIQWFRGPPGATTAPLRNIPWQVFTIAEFTDRTPVAISLGDINGDGRNDLVASAAGGLVWFDSSASPTVFDQWIEHLIVDEEEPNSGPIPSPATTDPNVTPEESGTGTLINSVFVIDLDGDGANDVIATLDRRGLSGLTNDALGWFRNNR